MKHEWLLCIKKWKVWLQNAMEFCAYHKTDSFALKVDEDGLWTNRFVNL